MTFFFFAELNRPVISSKVISRGIKGQTEAKSQRGQVRANRFFRAFAKTVFIKAGGVSGRRLGVAFDPPNQE